MRTGLSVLILLMACGPSGKERLRLRGDGLSVEVVSEPDEDQPHARVFHLSSSSAVDVAIDCRADEDRHERVLKDVVDESWTLFGLRASTDHDCTITARRGSKKVSGELSFRTGKLRSETPEIVVEGGKSWGAYTLFNTWATGHGGGDQQLLIVDPDGEVRWSMLLAPELLVGVEATPLGKRSLLIGGGKMPPHEVSLGGVVAWSFPDWSEDGMFWHHEASQTSRGTVLGLVRVPNVQGNRTWEGFRIEERTPGGELVNAIASQDLYDAGHLPFPVGSDPWHANAVNWVDGTGSTPDFLSLSLPHEDRILALEPDSGEVLWQLGYGLGFAMTEGSWFSGQHDPEWEGLRVLMHDNGTFGAHSRVVELEVDPERRTAEVLWEWTEPGWFEPLWGDADRLPDGTVLVTRGHCGFCGESGTGTSQIFVLDPETGDVPWKLVLPDERRGLYRAERVDGCGLFDNLRYCP